MVEEVRCEHARGTLWREARPKEGMVGVSTELGVVKVIERAGSTGACKDYNAIGKCSAAVASTGTRHAVGPVPASLCLIE